MRIFAFILSGIGLIVVWPFALMMTGFASDQPQVSSGVEFARGAMVLTLFAVPLVWAVSVIASLVTHLGMKVRARPAAGDTDVDVVQEAAARKAGKNRKERLLNSFAAAPYVAAGLHLAMWGLLAIIGR